jgi:hypothetical protein
MTWFRRRPTFAQDVAELIRDVRARRQRQQDEALLDQHIEITERAALPCVMCDEVGEPHVCEREFWRQRLAHVTNRVCADEECGCHVAARMREEAAAITAALPGYITTRSAGAPRMPAAARGARK